jgi:hypothetical protein
MQQWQFISTFKHALEFGNTIAEGCSDYSDLG